MKKLNFTFLFTMLMSMVGLNASAHDIEVQNADGKTIYYIFINNNTELAVTFKGLGSSSNINRYTGNVVIPESVTYNEKTYSVTSIGESAFQYCSGLTSVTIGSGVTSIGSQAFEDCTGLTSVTIGSGVTSIGSSAFKNCSDLTSIEIPNSVTSIVGGAFKGCSGLTSVTINSNAILSSSSKLSIFGSQVEQYIIGNSVTSIGSSAFYNCYGMTSITIPNSVTSIGEGAFSYCSGLTSITIPNSVTSIGNDAFSGCSGLTSIMVENGNSKYDSRDNCNAIIETSSNTLIRGCKNTEIPNSVTSIGDYAFDGCSGLTSIDIPNSVTSIGYKAFQSCSGLTSIEIPNSVTSIGGYAFSFCSGLTSVTIPNSVTSIGGYAFSYCSGLTSVNSLIETPFTVGTSDFESISNACVLTVPKGTRDAYLAAGWTEDVFKGGVVEETGDNIIFADANVKAICVANWDTNSDGELSYDEAEAVTNLGSVFRNKTSITSFDELQYFTGLTSIGNTAFYNCSGLTSVTIPNSVTSIGEGAFYNCSGLTSIEIPNSVTSIGQYAFCGCSGLTSIIIPNSVTIIESFAFEYCSGLTSIDIPNSVTSIGQFAFFECTGLTSIEIPNSVTSIGERAFSGCSGLTSVTIPNSVTSIGSAAFENCSGLTSVKSEIETPFAFGTSAFNSISNACVLTVPKGTRDAYLAAGWTEDVFKGGVVEDEIIEDVTIAMKTGSGADRTMIGYSSQYSLDFTDVTEVKAYIAIGFTSTKNVIMARVNIVPANTGVVLKSDVAGVEVEVPITTEDVYYANLLKPAVDNVTVYPSETIDDVDYTNLMVGTLINGQTGFITFSTPKAYSNKCYLRVPTEFYNSAAVASNGLEVVFVDSDATDIHQLMQDNDTTGDAFYDLYGRKVTPNKKGLYIRNGKKVFIQ